MLVVNKEGTTRNIDENQLPEYIRKGYVQVVEKVVEREQPKIKITQPKISTASKTFSKKKDTK